MKHTTVLNPCPLSRRPFLGLALIIPLTTLTACSALKFYPGEERADSTIGRLLFNSAGADMSVITIDGIQHPHPGRTVELLPGSHRIELKYQEQFEAPDGDSADNQLAHQTSGDGLTRYGACSLRFTIEPAQELFVFVDAGSHPIIGSSTPPTITLKEQGYDKPALFQERCKEEGKEPSVKKAG